MKINYMKLSIIILSLSVVASCAPKNETDSGFAEDTAISESPIITESQSSTASVAAAAFDVTGKDTITLPSGLRYILVQEGIGARPVTGKTVSVHYTGYLIDGTKFDSSIDSGQPIKFPLGTGRVIKGWDEGIALLNVGSKARFIIPHELGYGEEGYAPLIPPSSTLIFDVELVGAE